ncbi:MAG: TonB-dependent receptor [candidate division KSB1 bacterium]|nr:TonB-dependent receptor [candidate division KSB1 bacterium]
MRTTYFILMALWSILLSANSLAQPEPICTIKGSVINEKNTPLPFANIFLKGRMEGSVSDSLGNFSFKTKASGKVTLICSYIGYQSFEKELELKAGSIIEINIKLRQIEIRGRSVMVTASAFTATDEGEGVTLTAMDVVRTPGAAADLFWAIKTFPGLQQVDEGAGLFVRGGDVSETVVLLDGAIINHPYKYESPTGGFFGTFSPFLLKGTFFSSGGFSAQYGNALSGALAMESLDLPDQRAIGLGLGLAAESIYLAVPLVDDKFGFSLSGNRSNTKMMFQLNNCSKDFSQYPFSYDFNFNSVYKMNPQSQLKLFAYRAADKVGVEIDDPDYSTHFHGNNSNQLYNLKYNSLIQKKLLLQANLAFSNFKRDVRLSVMELDFEDRLYQARLNAEIESFQGYTLQAGMEFFKNQTLISGTITQNELDLSPTAPTDQVNTDYNSYRAAQFIELELFGPLGIKMTPGLRGEYESISKKYILDPRLALIYSLTPQSNLTASWGIYHQFPEPSYYDPYVGNPQLSSMKAVHYIIGYAFQQENKIFRLEGYYKNYSRLLLEDEQLNYVNQGHGYATGIDVFAKNSWGPISGWISYSWLKARRKWLDAPTLAPPYFDITHNLTLVLNATLPKNFSAGISFRYATGKPYTPAPDKYHQARVPDYLKLDLSLSYLRRFFENNITVFYLGISNLEGRINIYDYRYSPDYQRRDAVESSFGRSVYFGVSFNM